MQAKSVLIVEDDFLVASFIKKCICSIGLGASITTTNFSDSIVALQTNIIDIVLIDINLGEEKDGIDLAQFVNNTYHIPFLFLTSLTNKDTIDKAKLTHPYGYIVKPFSIEELAAAISIALYNFSQQKHVIQPKHDLTLSFLSNKIKEPISERELEILQLIYMGKTNMEIAALLFISVNTVKTHVSNILLKFNTSSRTTLIVKVRELILTL